MSKVILVTGGSSGLGAAICEHLSSKGHKVYGTSRKAIKTGSKYTMLDMDVSDRGSIEEALSIIIKKEGKLDVVINNAGLGMAAPLEESKDIDIDKLFSTNIRGVINVMQLTLPQLRKQKTGLIINITSIAAEIALPYRGLYCASKAAVEKITEALRMEIKDFGIQACTFQAGDIKTNINSNRLTAELSKNSAYATDFERINNEIRSDVNNAVSPYFYAEKIERILNTRKVKRTYVEGKFIQRFSRFLSRILPGNWFEKIILNHYKL
ncbi:MAG TPA: SDR family oxidoreductase [Cytophagaceae bacterium]|jgi:NADP-dependent 3-hydroxy acid dehydrogenase YdfG|nr:SDR family oxidoreductase [Cytophagaceae bacterium]